MDELLVFEAKLTIVKEINDLEADLRVSITLQKKLLKLSSADLIERRDYLKSQVLLHYF